MPPKKPRPYLVYCLQNAAGTKSYVGCTNDPVRRLRQHNGEITGGAKYTRGGAWHFVIHVCGFTLGSKGDNGKKHALQFEWAWKHAKRGNAGRASASSKAKSRAGLPGPISRRVRALERMLSRDKWRNVKVRAIPAIAGRLCESVAQTNNQKIKAVRAF